MRLEEEASRLHHQESKALNNVTVRGELSENAALRLLRMKGKLEESALQHHTSPKKKKSSPYTVSVLLRENGKERERSSSYESKVGVRKAKGRGALSPELATYQTQSLRNKFTEVKWSK